MELETKYNIGKKKEDKMKTGDHIIEGAKKQAEGEIAVHIANIKVYKTMPAGIGEHSDITESSYCRIR